MLFTEETFFTLQELLERWPGMDMDSIESKTGGRRIKPPYPGGEHLSPKDRKPFVPFPGAYNEAGPRRKTPDGNVLLEVELTNICDEYCLFKKEEVEAYQAANPEVCYPIIGVNKTPGPAGADAPVAREEIEELRASKATLEAELDQARTRITTLEAELAKEREAHSENDGAARGKKTDKATTARLDKNINAWREALAWMIPAAVAVGLEGPKPRTQPELWPFVEKAGGPTRGKYNEQFNTWRESMPDNFCDKKNRDPNPQKDRANPSQIDVESLEE